MSASAAQPSPANSSAAGYSRRSLIEKLGIKTGQRMAVIQAPADYADWLGPLPDQVIWSEELDDALDFVHFFATHQQEFADIFPRLKAALTPNGLLWISWPKRTSKSAAIKIPTDLDENRIREIGLANGLVDVKVAAIDQIWSGLKFVYRVKDRRK